MLNREDILAALQAAFEPLDYIHALWEAGSAAFDRVDQWSDIDLQVVVADDRVAEIVALADQTLTALSSIALRYEVPQPSWHGHAQVFYRLRDTSEYLLVDLAIMKLSAPDKFLQPEIHGNARVLFDKSNVVNEAIHPFDHDAHAPFLRARVETLRVMFAMFYPFSLKELYRGNRIEAIMYYQNLTLRFLVELLRIRYAPPRWNFAARYVYYDLPPEIVERIEPLFFIATPDDLRAKREQVRALFEETLAAMDD